MPPIALPPAFVARMRALLGDEADAFLAAYARPPVAGLRINTLKSTPDAFQAESPWPLRPVPWCPSGFTVGDEARPGRHPFHAAGRYYLQEPSAMAVVEALDVRPGHAALDLAAAPGGKATHIAAKLAGTGVLVANELIGSRIKALGENLERWGTAAALLLNEEPARLAAAFGPVFDRVLLDAPCSGEGMFRKAPAAIREWSLEHVAGSAARQAKILAEAARLTKPGGLLLYSTCTFAPEENEGQIARFLGEHPTWEPVEIPAVGGVERGRPDWADGDARLARTARLWPHRLAGEGHFLALLRNGGSTRPERATVPNPARTGRGRAVQRPPGVVPDATAAAWRAFCRETIAESPDWLLPALAETDRLREQGGTLFLLPDGPPAPPELRVVRPGLALGAARPGRFEPAHALALALPRRAAGNAVDLDVPAAERYLAGETIDRPGPAGWVLVTVEGWPLGWGRRSGSVVKNRYPKGLRRPLA